MRNKYNMSNICADMLVEIALANNAQNADDARNNISRWLKSYTENSELGAMLFNTNYHISYAPSKVWDMPCQKLGGKQPKIEEFDEGDWCIDYLKAHEMGIEPYSIAIEETRKTGAAVWFSVRMNEFHYMYRCANTAADLWLERPDLRLGKDKPFDYEKKEVRDYYLIYIKELCENWDIDGIELDFWRGPDFFNAPVTQEKAQIITDFVKEIRRAVDKIAEKKNKKIMISARTHITPALAMEHGWDSAQWVADKSIDVLTLSNFFVPPDCEIDVKGWIEKIAEKGGKREDYGINVCADYSAICIKYKLPEARWLAMDTVNLKGFASMYYDDGVDGIYTFNINNRDYYLPREERSADFSVFLSKNKVNEGKRRHILVNENYLGLKYKTHLKAEIEDGETLELDLDTSKVPRKGNAVIEIGTNQDDIDLVVKVNGRECKYIGKQSGSPFEENGKTNVTELSQMAKKVGLYEIPGLDVLKDRMNDYTIENKSGKPVEVIWFSVLIDAE